MDGSNDAYSCWVRNGVDDEYEYAQASKFKVMVEFQIMVA